MDHVLQSLKLVCSCWACWSTHISFSAACYSRLYRVGHDSLAVILSQQTSRPTYTIAVHCRISSENMLAHAWFRSISVAWSQAIIPTPAGIQGILSHIRFDSIVIPASAGIQKPFVPSQTALTSIGGV